MTAQFLEEPSPPWVELYAPGARLPEEKFRLTAANSEADPRTSLHHALLAQRIYMIERAKVELTGPVVSETAIREVLDAVWRSYVPIFHQATGPMLAQAYIDAFRKADAGDVPIQMIYALAEDHARRLSEYFHQTSTEALTQGFNTYVNRRVPERAAFLRVVEAYGLTPRQMSGFTSSKSFELKIESVTPQHLKAQIAKYILKSVMDRLKIFTRQESHNLDEQAQQVAWMWMVEHDKLPAHAQKMWVTAKDERVCPICGPMQGQKVSVGEQFLLDDRQRLYVPGAHTNCRCTVRLLVNPFTVVGKAERFDPREHPRGRRGRFVDVPEEGRSRDLEQMVREAQRARREEREAQQQRIEDAVAVEEPQEINLGLTAPVDLGLTKEGGLNLSGANLNLSGVDLGLTSPAVQDQPQNILGSPRVRLGLDDFTTTLDLGTKETLGLELARKLDLAATKIPTTVETRKNTVTFGKDGLGRLRKMYALIDYPVQVDKATGRVQLTLDDAAMPYTGGVKATDMFTKAIDKHDEQIYEMYKELVGSTDEHTISIPSRLYGTISADIQGEYVLAALDAAANPKAPWAHELTIAPEWYDKGGELIAGGDSQDPGLLSPYELSRLLEINKEDLEVVIVVMAEGAAESYQEQDDSLYGLELWRVPGTYMVVDEETDRLGFSDDRRDHAIPLRILTVVPEEPTETVVRPMTDEERKRARQLSIEEFLGEG